MDETSHRSFNQEVAVVRYSRARPNIDVELKKESEALEANVESAGITAGHTAHRQCEFGTLNLFRNNFSEVSRRARRSKRRWTMKHQV